MKQKNSLVLNKRVKTLKKLAIAFAVVLIATALYVKVQPYTHDAKLRTELESKSQQLQETKSQLEQTQTQSQQDAEAKQRQLDELNQKLQETQKALEAKRKSATVYAYTPPKPQVVIDGCGDNEYAHYIYMKESGCRTTAVNSIGCRGIGQACPGSKLPCGDDYACQNQWFTNYAISRYGSWANAYQFWLNNHWW